MKDFGDKIKRKLNQGEAEYSPASWEVIEKKLSEVPKQNDFEKKIQESLSESSIPMPIGSWNHFIQNANLLDGFENSLSKQLDNGVFNSSDSNWEDFSEKYDNSRLTYYEKSIKNVLNSKKYSINKTHWKAFEKLSFSNRGKKIFWRSAAILLLALSTGIGINELSERESNIHASIDVLNKNSSLGNENLNGNKNESSKLNTISNGTRPQFIGGKSYLKEIENSFKKNKRNYRENIPVNYKTDSKNSLIPFIHASIKKHLFSNKEMIKHEIPIEENIKIVRQINQGAILWLKFWENPALTGFYGKNAVSGFIINDWELIDENKDNQGEFNLVQPIVRIGSYERRLNKNWSIGGFLNYELKKNWNIRKYSTSVSYTKQILKGYHFRFGAGGTFISQNLAVNKLTVREKAINSDYVYTTQMGDLKSKEEYSSSYHIGSFLNHKKFFLGYTVFNIGSNNFTNENNITLMKHCFTGGIHSPKYKNIQASGILRYEQELFTSISPSIGISYKNQLFAMYEYKDLSGKKISFGYQMKSNAKVQINYNIKSLEDYQNRDLNLDNFTERKGYLSGGINYIF